MGLQNNGNGGAVTGWGLNETHVLVKKKMSTVIARRDKEEYIWHGL